MEFLSDLWKFLVARQKWFLMPLILVIIIIGAVVVFAPSSGVAPFIYSLF